MPHGSSVASARATPTPERERYVHPQQSPNCIIRKTKIIRSLKTATQHSPIPGRSEGRKTATRGNKYKGLRANTD